MSKKVSVLLSIYNVEKYLEECLDSILAQSYKNLEIVCVDNGSADGCGNILKQYAQKDVRIKIVSLSENKKLCGGRNAGLDNATGDFICFVDPDDWIEKDYIKTMVDTIQTKKDPDGNPFNLVVNYNVVNYMIVPGKKIKVYKSFDAKGNLKTYEEYNKSVKTEMDIPMWGRLYRKSFLDKYKIRFLEGFQVDNIPYTLKLMVHLKYWYCIQGEKDAGYWRRLVTKEGALTEEVVHKNLELPMAFDNLFDYFVDNKVEHKIRIPFHLFWILGYPNHMDKPRYYEKYKTLMRKMEDTIKSARGVYLQEDIDLCNYLLYTDNFFQFVDLYFRSIQMTIKNISKYTLKLFGIIPILKKRTTSNSIKYKILGIPVWKIKIKNDIIRCYLFDFIPFLKYIKK